MAKPYEALNDVLTKSSTLTVLVARSAVWHGRSPRARVLPNICYLEYGNHDRFTGMERQDFQVNCRASTPEAAYDLARAVTDVLHGTSSTGITGSQGTFEFSRMHLDTEVGVIAEPDSVYNVPLIITIVYPSSTVS